MRLFALIALTMTAFAANSVLNRAGVETYGLDPLAFAGLRLAAGAAILAGLVSARATGWPGWTFARALAALWLLVYLVPFSLAYMTLPSGIGALILFGVVQVTMFAGSALGGQRPGLWQWLGMGVAMAGLVWLLWPAGPVVPDPGGVAFMALAGVGWGLFSLRGRGSSDPLGDMAASFVLLMPVALVLLASGGGWSPGGVVCALASGAMMSGLGYALWYLVLPQIAATTAAVAQLSVPVIALVAGAVFLREAITTEIVMAAAVVLGGIAIAALRRP